MESKKINQLATELTPALSDLTIIGDPTTGISKKITLSQMASLFTGTVEEYASVSAFPLVGVADTIYIALDTNVLYRWDTTLTSYVELSPNIINSLVFSDANGFDGTISLVGSVATLTITTALTTGSVAFIGASGALTQDNSNFYWDNSNKRLGINTNAPTTAIDVFGSGIIGRLNGTSTNNSFLGFASAGTNQWSIGNVQSDHRFRIYSEANTAELVSVLQTGEFGIGIANPTTKLHIDGGASALIANLDANVSVAKSISFRSDNSNRINLEVSGTESGSNAGANLFIRTYTDAGSLLETPFQITRSTGLATFKNIAITGLTTNKVLKSNGSATIVESTITDDGTNVAISGGFAATTYIVGQSGSFEYAGKDNLVVSDSTSQATGVGGSILFRGVYTTGGSPLPFGRISLMKENSTNANYSFGLGFYTSANGGNNPSITPNMYLSGTGLLNIGTNQSGSARLNILNIALYPFISLRDSSNTYEILSMVFDQTQDLFTIMNKQAYSQSGIALGTNNTERLRINVSGFLKVSNTGIYSSSTSTTHEIIQSTNTWIAEIRNTGSVPYGLLLKYQNASPNITGDNQFIWCEDSTQSKFIVWSNGNVVNRNNSYGAISDIKLKENIIDTNSKLNDLLKVKIRNYNLIGDDKKQIGVIAQELEEIFPSMIEEFKENNSNESIKSVKYSVFVPILIKSIQEQQVQIEELKSKLK